MALAFYGLGDLPKDLYGQPFDLSYLEEAVSFVTGLGGQVSGDGVGVYCNSRGGDIALGMCAFFGEKVKAMALVNTMCKALGVPLVWKGQVRWQILTHAVSKMLKINSYTYSICTVYTHLNIHIPTYLYK